MPIYKHLLIKLQNTLTTYIHCIYVNEFILASILNSFTVFVVFKQFIKVFVSFTGDALSESS